MTEIELCGLKLGAGHRGLGTQILELLQADDLVGVKIFASLQVARGLVGKLPRLFDLRANFRQLDLGQPLALFDHVAFLHVDPAHEATEFERQAHLVFRDHDAVGVDGRHGGPVARLLDSHRRGLVVRGRLRPPAARQQSSHRHQRDEQCAHQVTRPVLGCGHGESSN